MLNLDMKIIVSFESQNPKKVFLPLSPFFYEKGGVIKHVEAPAINKVELLVTMWNRVKYFITHCSPSCMSVLLSTTQFGISL